MVKLHLSGLLSFFDYKALFWSPWEPSKERFWSCASIRAVKEPVGSRNVSQGSVWLTAESVTGECCGEHTGCCGGSASPYKTLSQNHLAVASLKKGSTLCYLWGLSYRAFDRVLKSYHKRMYM